MRSRFNHAKHLSPALWRAFLRPQPVTPVNQLSAKLLFFYTAISMLTYRELKAIQEGNRRNQDVMNLLREVKRLRELAVLTYSILGTMPLNGLGENMYRLNPLFEALKMENAVQGYMRASEHRDRLNFPHRTQGRDGDMAYYLKRYKQDPATKP